MGAMGYKYSDLLQDLDGFDAWLISIGLPPRPNDRIPEAFRVLRRAEELSRKGRATGIYSDIQPGDWFPLIEALEAHEVFTAFHDDPSPAVGATLKRALSGPFQPIDENQKNETAGTSGLNSRSQRNGDWGVRQFALESRTYASRAMASRFWSHANDLQVGRGGWGWGQPLYGMGIRTSVWRRCPNN